MPQAVEQTKQYAPPKPPEGKIVVVRLGEITLKKKNRPMFVRQLGRNIRKALRGLDLRDLALSPNRLLLTMAPDVPFEEVGERLSRVFGVKNFSLCDVLPWDVDAIRDEVLRRAAEQPFESLRISVQRSDKRFPGTSQELERAIGAAVKAQSGARVDLEHPEAKIGRAHV